MDNSGTGREKLENAYALKTPHDNVIYYRSFAKTYDSDFAKGLGYCYPAMIAEIYLSASEPHDGPIADIGCGTGLVGVALDRTDVDGMDISPEMLNVARDRKKYRSLYEVNLLEGVEPLPKSYGAVLSAGTFTHGHLGAEVLVSILDIARPGALFVVGVNQKHYHDRGFESVMRDLQNTGRIGPVKVKEVPIYDRTDHAHSEDRARVLIWRLI